MQYEMENKIPHKIAKKREKDLLDFNDLEHYALKLLYNSDGTPSNVTYELDGVTRSMQMWFYEDGNLTESKFSTIFVYEDESLKNNPFAQDFVVGYFAFSDVMEPFLYAPYLGGKHPFVSRLLPSAFIEDPGNGVVSRADITYAFDDDGYVSEAEWRSSSYHMEFAYVEP